MYMWINLATKCYTQGFDGGHILLKQFLLPRNRCSAQSVSFFTFERLCGLVFAPRSYSFLVINGGVPNRGGVFTDLAAGTSSMIELLGVMCPTPRIRLRLGFGILLFCGRRIVESSRRGFKTP